MTQLGRFLALTASGDTTAMNALATSFARRIADHAQSEGGKTEVIQSEDSIRLLVALLRTSPTKETRPRPPPKKRGEVAR